MVTEQMQRVLDILTSLPPEEQDRVAAAIQTVLDQPAITSDETRPEVMAAFEQVMERSTSALEYLRDK
jgi:DNA/RNA-binding domain of Phe-tRNA-synthetase-like protein